jgi:hypothetical protein
MNILRCIDVNYNTAQPNQSNEGALIDFEYIQDEENNFKSVDVRIYAIINSIVGKKLPVNIIDKLVVANEMLRYLESEKNK